MECEAAADVTRIGVGVLDDGVAGGVDGLAAAANQPFAASAASRASPVTFLKSKCVAFVQVRLERGQGLAGWRPLVLPRSEIVVRL